MSNMIIKIESAYLLLEPAGILLSVYVDWFPLSLQSLLLFLISPLEDIVGHET